MEENQLEFAVHVGQLNGAVQATSGEGRESLKANSSIQAGSCPVARSGHCTIPFYIVLFRPECHCVCVYVCARVRFVLLAFAFIEYRVICTLRDFRCSYSNSQNKRVCNENDIVVLSGTNKPARHISSTLWCSLYGTISIIKSS